jgi:tape measure domain-containing protein
MDNGVRYVVSIDGRTQAMSVLRDMEGAAVRTEASITSLNNALKMMAGALGVGFGLHALVDFGKDAVQGAADYETAVKRIKFASENLAEGMKNIAFISAEADKFKIPLQSTTDSYGKFLAMLAGSDISSTKVRKLHDELLLIGKVKGLGDGQLDAAVMNLGKMLEAGGLDARHFRPLEQQLSGIGSFVAKELGITVHQLAVLRNQGKLTQIDPKVLLTAIEKQAASLEKFLPEATTTIQSQLNDLDNSWLRFKNDLVFDNLPELRSLFDTLKSGVSWLKEHEEGIINFGKLVFTIGKAWLEYRAVMLLVNGTNALWLKVAGEEATALVRQTTGTAGLNRAVQELNVSMARLVELQEAAAISGKAMTDAQMMAGAQGLPINIPMAGAPSIAQSITSAITNAALTFIVADAVFHVMGVGTRGSGLQNTVGYDDNGDMVAWYDIWGRNEYKKHRAALARNGVSEEDINLMSQNGWSIGSGLITGSQGANIDALMGGHDYSTENPFFPNAGGKGRVGGKTGVDKIVRPNDHVTGQRVVTYNIQIKEINGIKQNTVENGGSMQTDAVAAALRDVIISVVNDSQLTADH